MEFGELGKPMPLMSNKGKSYQGSIVLGKGFILTPEEALSLIDKDPRNKEVLFPYLNGDDLNNDPEQKPSRWVINFFDWDEEKAKTYPDCYEIVEKLVKPERQRWKKDNDGNEIVGTYALRKPLPQRWWIYGEKRPALYNAISELDQVMVIPLVSKYSSFDFSYTNTVFMHKLGVIILNDFHSFAILSSSIHNIWCWKYSSTLGSGTLNYSTTDCFENYPFPKNNISIEDIGKQYYEYRKYLMRISGLGLTKISNLFHSKGVQKDINLKDNHVLHLKKHLQKSSSTDSYNFIIEGVIKLRKLYTQMDKAVIDIYDWNDIQLNHGFYELEYLPKNDRVRFSIDPAARKEILKRLLLLNLLQHGEESKVGTAFNGKKTEKLIKNDSTDHSTLFPEI